jgi:hypothetical protein
VELGCEPLALATGYSILGPISGLPDAIALRLRQFQNTFLEGGWTFSIAESNQGAARARRSKRIYKNALLKSALTESGQWLSLPGPLAAFFGSEVNALIVQFCNNLLSQFFPKKNAICEKLVQHMLQVLTGIPVSVLFV